MKDLKTLAEIVRRENWSIYRIAEFSEGAAREIVLREGNRCSNSYSVAKVFTVAAVGLLRDEGKLTPEEKITEILRDEIAVSPAAGWESVTLDHLMRHRCGLPRGFLDIDCCDSTSFGRDFLGYTLAQPLNCPPGTERSYSDGAFYLAARAVENRCGMPLDHFLWERLLEPMGFREAAFSRCPLGHVLGATGLYLQAEDMVKMGGLWLNGGVWKGKRLLSEEWIALTRERGYEMNPVGSRGDFGKGGMYGQMLLVLPRENRALAWHGHDSGGKEALVSLLTE